MNWIRQNAQEQEFEETHKNINRITENSLAGAVLSKREIGIAMQRVRIV